MFEVVVLRGIVENATLHIESIVLEMSQICLLKHG